MLVRHDTLLRRVRLKEGRHERPIEGLVALTAAAAEHRRLAAAALDLSRCEGADKPSTSLVTLSVTTSSSEADKVRSNLWTQRAVYDTLARQPFFWSAPGECPPQPRAA